MKIVVRIEKIGNGEYWGQTTPLGNVFVTGRAETIENLLKNIRASMLRFKKDNAPLDVVWRNLDPERVHFEIIMKES